MAIIYYGGWTKRRGKAMNLETGRTDGAPSGRGSMRDWLHALIVVCTWVLFFYWWYIVLPVTLLSDAAWALLAILVVSLCTVVLTLGWVRYNLGIYRRKGPRRKIPEVSERVVSDALGRDLVHGGWEALRASRLIIVSVDDANRKTMSAGEN
jgi:hypothetical protein